MSLSEELVSARVHKLHSRFLKASVKYPKLYHFAVRQDLESFWSDLAFFSPKIERNRNRYAWQTTIYSSVYTHSRVGPVIVDSPPHQFEWADGLWLGHWSDPCFEDSPMHTTNGINEFWTLAEEALSSIEKLCHDYKQIHVYDEWGREFLPWLETLHLIFAPDVELVVPRPDIISAEEYNTSYEIEDVTVSLVTLPWNVFHCSAVALERLVNWPSLLVYGNEGDRIEPSGTSVDETSDGKDTPSDGEWFKTDPPSGSEFKHGPIGGKLKELEVLIKMDGRTLRKHNGTAGLWIKKIHGRLFEVWFSTQKRYAEVNQKRLSAVNSNDMK